MIRPIVVNKRFAVRCSFLFLMFVGATVHQASLEKWQSKIAASQQRAGQSKEGEQNSRERSKALSSDSTIALDRVRDGCDPIVLTANNRPARFQAGLRVFDAQTFPTNPKTPRFDKLGNPINGVQPLPEGLTICNEFGDTAIVSVGGAISEIKRVQPSKLSEFLSYYNRKSQEKAQ